MSSAAVDCSATAGQPLTHDGLLYRSPADYIAGVVPFVEAGLAAEQPTLVAVPGPNLELLRDGLDGTSSAVHFADMTTVGRNPARIIPAILRFVDAHPSQRVRFVAEPIWPGRTEAEICEATRHEAMLNTALADAAIDILCPYDATQLEPAAVDGAWLTHAAVLDRSQRHDSPHYTDQRGLYSGDAPLAPSPADARSMSVDSDDLPAIRRFVQAFAAEVGLASRRTQDLVLAVNEIATNTILYTPGAGRLEIWADAGIVACEIRDSGFIADALAGRRLPSAGADHGRGLWMANQLCDLVQLRSTVHGTTIRLQVDRFAR